MVRQTRYLLKLVALLTLLLLSGCAGSELPPAPTRPATATPAKIVAVSTDTPVATHTQMPTATATPPAPTVTLSPTPIPTQTPAPTLTHTPLPTATATPQPTNTIPPSPSPTPWGCTVLVDALNVRSGPGTGYGVLRVAHAGNKVTPLGQSAAGDWIYAMSPAGDAGWLSVGYLECAPATGSVPIMTPPPLPTLPPAPTIAPTATTSAYQYLATGPARPDPSHPCPG